MLYITSDHAGFEMKSQLVEKLTQSGLKFVDLSKEFEKNDDYPIKAIDLALEIKKDIDNLGIAICGTGIGMSITLNRFSGIFASNIHDTNEAQLFRLHNHGNVLCLSGRFLDVNQAFEIVNKFLNTFPSQEDRHLRRLTEIP